MLATVLVCVCVFCVLPLVVNTQFAYDGPPPNGGRYSRYMESVSPSSPPRCRTTMCGSSAARQHMPTHITHQQAPCETDVFADIVRRNAVVVAAMSLRQFRGLTDARRTRLLDHASLTDADAGTLGCLAAELTAATAAAGSDNDDNDNHVHQGGDLLLNASSTRVVELLHQNDKLKRAIMQQRFAEKHSLAARAEEQRQPQAHAEHMRRQQQQLGAAASRARGGGHDGGHDGGDGDEREYATGPRGGINYINSYGNKQYVKRAASRARGSGDGDEREYATGPRGGIYYINSSGNKQYVKRQQQRQRSRYGQQPQRHRQMHTGPRGGRYFINGNGRKSYVKRGRGRGRG